VVGLLSKRLLTSNRAALDFVFEKLLGKLKIASYVLMS
jgi:hypothetical protein